MREEVWTEKLRCDLNDDEVRAKADTAAHTWKGVIEAEAEQKALAEEARGAIKGLRNIVDESLRCVAERAEYRQVDVVERRNDREGQIEVVRVDTGEIVRSRPFTHDERQLGLLPQPEADEG